jgi:hypothetical protein
VVLAGAMVSIAPGARAAALTPCDEYRTGGTIRGNVVVRSGGVCVLDGVTVKGQVTVDPYGQLNVYGGKITGGLTATEGQVLLQTANIGGNAIFDSPELGIFMDGSPLSICGSTIGGAVIVKNASEPGDVGLGLCFGDTAQPAVNGYSNLLKGNVEIRHNHGPDIAVYDNKILGNLICVDNDPEPFGTGNVVKGSQQCSSLGAP